MRLLPRIWLILNLNIHTDLVGRSHLQHTYQKAFKKSWKSLLPVSGGCYDTNVTQCTCKCGRRKYHRHHLCKHFVQDPLRLSGTRPFAGGLRLMTMGVSHMEMAVF